MINLPDTWYFPVPVKTSQSEPFWLNKKYIMEIDALASGLRELTGTGNQLHEYDLGIATHLHSSPFIHSEEEWADYLKSVFMFKADRFFNPYSPDMGSGRNVIFKNGCWKGVGRNYAATRIEHRHSSGLMSYSETMIEIFFDRLLDKIDSSIHVPIWGGFCYQDRDSCFLVRSADSVRCSQVPAFLKDAEKEIFLNYLSLKFSGSNSSTWLPKIMTKAAALMRDGIFHISPTRDNITIDGRFLDNFSMEWIEGSKNINSSFEIFTEEILFPFPAPSLNWKKILSSKIKHLASPANYLSSQYHAINSAYTALGIHHTSWEESVPVLSSILNLPHDFFHFHSNTLINKINYAHGILSQAELAGAYIEVTQKSNRHFLISVGKRIHNEVAGTLSKLLSISTLEDQKTSVTIMKEVLGHVLKKYKLSI